MHPNLAQQQEMLQILMDSKPEGAEPILHSDMGWQYQHETYIRTLADNGFIQSMSRKGNCIDNGATEQVFGHLKDEFFRGQDWQTFESFKADLDAYITHWNTTRRQVKLKGLTPAEYRDQPSSKPHNGYPFKASKFRGAVHNEGSRGRILSGCPPAFMSSVGKPLVLSDSPGRTPPFPCRTTAPARRCRYNVPMDS